MIGNTSPSRVEPPPPRVIVDSVTPEIDAGVFPIKRILGDPVDIVAHLFADGHDRLAAVVRHRKEGESAWHEVPLEPQGNDVWTARFVVDAIGRHEYVVIGWIDRFATWCRDIQKKHQAGLDIDLELREGALLVEEAARSLPSLAGVVSRLRSADPQAERVRLGLDPALAAVMAEHLPRGGVGGHSRILKIVVDPPLARFGAWYEVFPRSCAPEPDRQGTLQDLIARLPAIAAMGFDVLYLPPIHPIGRAFRKGKNNALTAGPGDPGSPWGIGSEAGGHDAIHPELGTFEDFEQLVAAARDLGLAIALDIAFQCSPDHPWVAEHPDWFRTRPDGSIQYAENPPKKYQDIYPLDFETDDWRALWDALAGVFLGWIERGVTVFRVDNPHTKAFRFWAWAIPAIKARHPEALFLSEAFTRPKPLAWLAKCGFSQSYTYFTWRNTKRELEDYFRELTSPAVLDYLRPNLFANTPDILHEFLQVGGPAAFRIRLLLAATLGATYGIYGPMFERCVGTPLRPGSEEYLDSEKYEARFWGDPPAHDLSMLIGRVNQIRRDHPALWRDDTLRFHGTDSDSLICYHKRDPGGTPSVLVVVNLDPTRTVSGWVWVTPWDFDLPPGSPLVVRDLLRDEQWEWPGEWHYVRLDPAMPAHIFEVR